MRRVRTFIKHRTDIHELSPHAPLTVGRSERCAIVLDDELASREHCRIELVGEDVRVTDLGSRNGLLLNGMEVKGTVTVHHGDVVTAGRSPLLISRQERAPRHSDSSPPKALRETAPTEATAAGNLMQILSGAVRRSLEDGQEMEADRTGRNLFSAIRTRFARGVKVREETVHDAAEIGLRLAERLHDVGWLERVLELHVSAELPASAETAQELSRLGDRVGEPSRALEPYLAMVAAQGVDPGPLG